MVDTKNTGRFGTPCTVPPRGALGTVSGEQNTCGPYPCIEGRCRSCLDDAECQTELGAPTCARLTEANRWPGNSCGNYSNATASAPTRRKTSPPIAPNAIERLAVEVVKTYPHSRDAHTEGLIFREGELLESTGTEGASQLRKLALESGEVLAKADLSENVFGEGLALDGGRLVQLTLSSERALVWDLASLKPLGELPYEGEGWGLCHDGTQFIMSDGTGALQLRDSQSFSLLKTIDVGASAGSHFRFLRLNELECVKKDVYANVFEYRELVRISLSTGAITAIIDTRNLLRHPDVPPGTEDLALDLNGIAYMPENDHFLLTGKYWPRVFEVRFVVDELFR